MRKTLLLFSLVFFLFGVFVYGKSASNYSFGLADENGIVLGESEDAPMADLLNDVDLKNSFLPKAEAKNNLPPLKKTDGQDYDLKNGKVAVFDCDSGSVVYEKGASEQVAIASITKLATALVFLKKNLSLDSVYEIRESDKVEGGLLYLRVGDLVEVKDLLNLSLVSSDNMATMALVNASGLSLADFIGEMNAFAKENDLKDTVFVDAIGLAKNLSTAVDVANLANLAFTNELIADIVAQTQYGFTTKNGRKITAKSTNILLNDDDGGVKNLAGKTGFTNLAGYCFVGKFVNKDNQNIIVVVLDETEKTSRFYQARNLAKWAYDSYSWNN
jgi:D-alanyl-D-alanine carboxypeptidase